MPFSSSERQEPSPLPWAGARLSLLTAATCFAQGKYQFLAESQQAVFVGDDQAFHLAGYNQVQQLSQAFFAVVHTTAEITDNLVLPSFGSTVSE